jgi:hypothetical protein
MKKTGDFSWECPRIPKENKGRTNRKRYIMIRYLFIFFLIGSKYPKKGKLSNNFKKEENE